MEIKITETYSTVPRHSAGAVLLDCPLTFMYQASATTWVVLVHTPLTALPPLSAQHHPASSRSFLLARYCVHLWPPPSPSYSFLAPNGVLTSSMWFPISLQMSRFSPASAKLGISFSLDLQPLSSRQTHQVVCWLLGDWETQLLNISEGPWEAKTPFSSRALDPFLLLGDFLSTYQGIEPVIPPLLFLENYVAKGKGHRFHSITTSCCDVALFLNCWGNIFS